MKKLIYWCLFFLGTPCLASGPSFEEIFPYYAEVCGLSKTYMGNSWGHSVIYLKGACRERTPKSVLDSQFGKVSPWQLKLCDEADSSNRSSGGGASSNEDQGILLSANIHVANSHWIAIPGRSLAMNGGLADDDPYDTAHVRVVWNRILAAQSFDGLRLRDSSRGRFEQDMSRSTEEFLIETGFGTDFAFTLARNAKCWKIPVNQKQMKAMVDYANRLNQEEYSWNALTSNCNHLAVGILSAAKILDPIKTGMVNCCYLSRIIPTHTLARLVKYTKVSIPTVEKVFSKKRFRESLVEFGRLPVEYGNLWENIPFKKRGNLTFVENDRRWGWWGDSGKIRTFDTELSLTDLNASLADYAQRLEVARRAFGAKTLEERLKWVSAQDRPDFVTIFNLYRAWIQSTTDQLTRIRTSRQ